MIGTYTQGLWDPVCKLLYSKIFQLYITVMNKARMVLACLTLTQGSIIMSILNSLGAAASVTFGGSLGAYVAGHVYLKVVGVDLSEGLKPEDMEKVNMTHGVASVIGGALVGAFAGAWAHSALTDTSVSVPTIAGGISVSSVGGLTPPAVV